MGTRSNPRPEIDPKLSFDKRDVYLSEWEKRGDQFLDFNSVDRFSHVQNFVPFSVFPISHKLRVKLMTGAMIVGGIINVSVVLRYLNTRGWATIKSPQDYNEESKKNGTQAKYIASLKKGPMSIQLPVPLFGRLGHEYLSIKTLGDVLDAILSVGKQPADGLFFNFTGERDQWD